MLARTLLVFGLVALAATACFAHIEPGEYRGVTAHGDACSFKVLRVEFAYGVPNPLNERVVLEASGVELTLSHPPQIDTNTSRVDFDGAHLTATRGTDFGALAAVLVMSHSHEHHGPVSITFVHFNANDPNDTGKIECLNLAHVGHL